METLPFSKDASSVSRCPLGAALPANFAAGTFYTTLSAYCTTPRTFEPRIAPRAHSQIYERLPNWLMAFLTQKPINSESSSAKIHLMQALDGYPISLHARTDASRTVGCCRNFAQAPMRTAWATEVSCTQRERFSQEQLPAMRLCLH